MNATSTPTKYAAIDGRSIAYRSIGQGRPFVLCQRFRGNLDDWDPAFLDALAKHYHVVIFDYSGFGLSTGKPPTTMAGFAQDVKDLLWVLKIDSCIIGGWSFGGAVAQIVTAESASMISHAILIGTRPPGHFVHAPEQLFLDTSSKPHNDFEDEVVLFFEPASAISRKKAKLSHDRIAARTTDNDLYIAPALWPHYYAGFEDYTRDPYNAREKLSKGKTPVLVISADHEIVFPPENWFALNRHWQHLQVVVIPQSGHGPHHQYPEMVAEYIRSFIETHQ